MPYVDRTARVEIGRGRRAPRTPGELNYAITKLITEYLSDKGTNYTYINDCLGALEGAKLEFYRRVVVPYEEGKLLENGDVYPGKGDTR